MPCFSRPPGPRGVETPALGTSFRCCGCTCMCVRVHTCVHVRVWGVKAGTDAGHAPQCSRPSVFPVGTRRPTRKQRPGPAASLSSREQLHLSGSVDWGSCCLPTEDSCLFFLQNGTVMWPPALGDGPCCKGGGLPSPQQDSVPSAASHAGMLSASLPGARRPVLTCSPGVFASARVWLSSESGGPNCGLME